MLETTNIYENGKVFKEIDYQIMVRKEKIKLYTIAIKKAFKLAGIDGPRGNDNMSVDYSRVTTSTPAAHIGIADAYRMVERDQATVKQLQNEINQFRNRKRNLMRTLKSLEGIEAQIFIHRVLMGETQESTAEIIGFSYRHIQRIEKQMKDKMIEFEIS